MVSAGFIRKSSCVMSTRVASGSNGDFLLLMLKDKAGFVAIGFRQVGGEAMVGLLM